jgi:hypothetical protein
MRERDGYREQLETVQRAAPAEAANGKRGAEEGAEEAAAKKVCEASMVHRPSASAKAVIASAVY